MGDTSKCQDQLVSKQDVRRIVIKLSGLWKIIYDVLHGYQEKSYRICIIRIYFYRLQFVVAKSFSTQKLANLIPLSLKVKVV